MTGKIKHIYFRNGDEITSPSRRIVEEVISSTFLICIQRKAIMALSEELLNILACPKCKGDIYINDTNDGLICDNCKLLYEIRDDIPIMLIDEAKSIDSLK